MWVGGEELGGGDILEVIVWVGGGRGGGGECALYSPPLDPPLLIAELASVVAYKDHILLYSDKIHIFWSCSRQLWYNCWHANAC